MGRSGRRFVTSVTTNRLCRITEKVVIVVADALFFSYWVVLFCNEHDRNIGYRCLSGSDHGVNIGYCSLPFGNDYNYRLRGTSVKDIYVINVKE